MSRSVVREVKLESLYPKVKDADAAALLPTVVKPQHASFVVSGCNVAIANGIRRVMLSELPVYGLTFDYGSYRTNMLFMLNDYVRTRIRCIPIMQNIDEKATFRLNVMNTTESPLRVKSRDIIPDHGKRLPFNETFDIAMLDPGKHMAIDRIYVERMTTSAFGGYNVAVNVACTTVDQTPVDLETGEGIPSALSDPREHRITATLQGTMTLTELMHATCDVLIERLDRVIKAIPNVYNTSNVYFLVLPNETHTIGNIIVKGVCDAYPSVPLATYSADHMAKTITISIKTTDDIETVLIDVSKRAIKTLTEVRSQFKH